MPQWWNAVRAVPEVYASSIALANTTLLSFFLRQIVCPSLLPFPLTTASEMMAMQREQSTRGSTIIDFIRIWATFLMFTRAGSNWTTTTQQPQQRQQ